MNATYFSRRRHRVPYNPADEENVTGKIVIVTGANSGLGKETAKALVKRGAIVVLACRSEEKTQAAIQDIKASLPAAAAKPSATPTEATSDTTDVAATNDPGSRLIFMKLDLEELASIRTFADEFKAKYQNLHILILNAGVSDQNGVLLKTKEGFEFHMGVNHLGHFLLTNLLLDRLKASAPARVVVVSSLFCVNAKLDIDDLMLEKIRSHGRFNVIPYANSKYANLLFTKELAKRLEGSGVTVNALCPGMVETNVFRTQGWFMKLATKFILVTSGSKPERGCETTLLCALSKKLADVSGKMYQFGYEWDGIMEKLDDEQAKKLWEKSEALVGLSN